MATKVRSAKVSHSFSRVLFLVYLSCAGHPSAVPMIGDYLDVDYILRLVGHGNVAAQIFQCVTKIFEDKLFSREDTTKQFQRVYNAAKLLEVKTDGSGQNDINQPYVYEAFALALYLATLAFDLYFRELPEQLENAEEYRREIDILYDNEIVSVLDDIDDLLQNWQEYKIEKSTEHILAMLEAITSKLSNFLQKIKADKLRAIVNEGRFRVIGAVSGAVAVGSGVIAFAFPPAGALMAFGYIATISIGSVTAVVSNEARLCFVKLKEQFAKLQDKTYKYKDQIAAGKSKINKILMKSYRTERVRSNPG